MATNLPTYIPANLLAQFDLIATQIQQTFDPLIAQLTARRDALLLELSEMREDYTNKETTRRAAILEIETAQQQMRSLSLKVNVNLSIHKQATDIYKQGMEQLEVHTKLPCPHFNCPTLHKLQSIIAEFGDVLEWEVPDYSLKKKPFQTAGKLGKGINELKAMGLAIDESNKLIYIADFDNKRVQVVSFKGEFVKRFGTDKLRKPWGIALTNDHIYVTDTLLHALFQFNKNSFELVNRIGTKGEADGQFDQPTGLCIEYSGDLLVADGENNRVCVFSPDLKFKSNLGVGLLRYPKDVKLTPDCLVVVLDWNPKCVHFFSRNGHFISSCVSQGVEPDCVVSSPYFICIDPAGIIIISDWGNHSLKIKPKYSQLLHTVGKEGHGRGELFYPSGISVSKSGVIYVVSRNTNFSVQCF